MRTISLLTVTVALGVLAAGSAVAGVTVLGTGKARACYEAAEFRDYTREALKLCSEALAEEPMSQRDRAATFVNRGIVRMGLKDLDGAIADYGTALGVRKHLGEAYVNMGIAYMLQARDQEALQALTQGLSLSPSRAHVGYYTRGVVHELMGDVRAAYHDYRKAAELAPAWDEPKAQLQRFRVISADRKMS